ncbi:MAG: L,D-transpeptidase family protein [Pseudomonadales bacterium]|nr:L,D-transpeptidase family protein [Pseudomonadales bacterium]
MKTFMVVALLLVLPSRSVLADDGLAERLPAYAANLTMGEPVRTIYARTGYRLLWNADAMGRLLALLATVAAHGLDPADFPEPGLVEPGRLDMLAPQEREIADVALTHTLLRYVHVLRFGQVDPWAIEADWNYSRQDSAATPADVVVDALMSADFVAVIKERTQRGGFYRRLMDWLQTYRALRDAGGWDAVEDGPTLKPDAVDARIPALRRRLAAEGFTTPEPVDATVFDADLVALVKQWQWRHGLDADGVIGARTHASLNDTAQQLVDRLRVNLERLRWEEPQRTGRAVLVNIAGYTLYLLDGETVQWTSRTVVGRPYRQTPVLTARITHLVFNPSWTVPPTILYKDTLPAIRRDAGYLAANHMQVLTGDGQTVDPNGVDWSGYRRGGFPYQIRQAPGVWNALGKVKFNMPNPQSVYLHDTPSKNLFEKSERSFSSGCIRVENALTLASLLLAADGGDTARIDQWTAQTRTHYEKLASPVPVMLQYLTALDTEGEGLRLYADVYGRDARLLAALDQHQRVEVTDKGSEAGVD